MMIDFRCCWQNHDVGDLFRYYGDFLNVLNRSPTSQTCHQHILSPISVTNIDVTSRDIFCWPNNAMETSKAKMFFKREERPFHGLCGRKTF